jgi:hypothetical protein
LLLLLLLLLLSSKSEDSNGSDKALQCQDNLVKANAA